MKIIGAIQAYQEGGRIGPAVKSLLASGCDSVFVLDGAWTDPTGATFGDGPQASDDGTLDEARDAGARVDVWSGVGSDADKQTALLVACGAVRGDYVVKIDADERIEGRLRGPGSHAMIMLSNEGDNDIPGVRGTWPRGDDSDAPIPLWRMFKWSPDLVCLRPGRWTEGGRLVEPYLVGALAASRAVVDDQLVAQAHRLIRDHEAMFDPALLAALPILDDVMIRHYRDGSKASAKRAYYEAVAVDTPLDSWKLDEAAAA